MLRVPVAMHLAFKPIGPLEPPQECAATLPQAFGSYAARIHMAWALYVHVLGRASTIPSLFSPSVIWARESLRLSAK